MERGIGALQQSINSYSDNQTDSLNKFLGWKNNSRMSETDW
jgi:hypothetical protein